MHDAARLSSNTDDTDALQAYKVRDVAKLLDFSERYTWNLVTTGKIESFTVGKSRRISRRAVRQFIEQRESAS